MLIYKNELEVKEVRGFFSIQNGWIIDSYKKIVKITVDSPPKSLSQNYEYIANKSGKRCVLAGTCVRYFYLNGELSELYNSYEQYVLNDEKFIKAEMHEREFDINFSKGFLVEERLIRKITGIENSYIIISTKEDLMSFELPTKEQPIFATTSPDGLMILVITKKEFIIIDNPMKS